MRWRTTVLVTLLALTTGCSELVYRVGVPFLYVDAPLPADRMILDLPYQTGDAADADTHRLDLFLPDGVGWPVLVFVHGGGWTSGDRALRVGGVDVYRNVGRFFAARGIGVAVISYRLQPAVDWRAQLDDVTHAVAWVHRKIGRYGGNPDAIFLSGHSAGGQMAARVALDGDLLGGLGVDRRSICGLIPVSAAGLDLTDPDTYALGADPAYYAQRFRADDPTDGWRMAASPIRFASRDAPPTLLLYASGDTKDLQRQSQLLDAALRAAGASSRIAVVPGESHARMVLTLSRADKAGTTILDFIRATACVRRQ